MTIVAGNTLPTPKCCQVLWRPFYAPDTDLMQTTSVPQSCRVRHRHTHHAWPGGNCVLDVCRSRRLGSATDGTKPDPVKWRVYPPGRLQHTYTVVRGQRVGPHAISEWWLRMPHLLPVRPLEQWMEPAQVGKRSGPRTPVLARGARSLPAAVAARGLLASACAWVILPALTC